MSKRLGPVLLAIGILTGCAATPLNPEARMVRIVTSEPAGCKYLGEVTGNQGDFFTGEFTSNANLETGARNSMKNEAVKLGANTVQLISNRAGQTGSFSLSQGTGGGSSEQTNVTYVGVAYKCPESR